MKAHRAMRYLIHCLKQRLSFRRCACPDQGNPHSHHLTRFGYRRFAPGAHR